MVDTCRKPLLEVCDLLDSKRVPVTSNKRIHGPYPYYGANGIQDYVNDYIFDDDLVLLAEDGGNFGSKDKPIAYRVSGKCWVNNHAHVLKPREGLNVDYLCYSLMYYDTKGLVNGATRKKLTQTAMKNIKIPILAYNEQLKIVKRIAVVSTLINNRKKELGLLDELVKSRFIEMFGDLINEPKYPGIKLGSLGVMITGGTPSRKHDEYYGGNIPFISTPCLGSNFISEKNVQNYLTEAGVKNSATHKIPPYSLMVGNRVGVGKSSINTCEMCTNQDILSFVHIDTNRFDLLFLKKVIDQYSPYFDEHKRGATIQGVPSKVIKDSMVPDVPLEMQKRYTALVKQSDKSKLAVQKSLDELEILKKSLMQTYFG